MAAKFNFAAAVLALVVLAAAAVGKTSAATYVVGDSLGWMIPPGGASTYSNWASRHTFRVGDTLVFNFTTGFHDVAEVTKASYDGCSSSNPISLVTVGPASINLTASGPTYFICTFSQHCSLGQKLGINVTSANSTTPPPSAAPSPKTSPTPAPSPTPTPPIPAPTPTPAPATPTPAPGPAPTTAAPTPGSAPSPSPASVPSSSPAPGPGGPAPTSGAPSSSAGGGSSPGTSPTGTPAEGLSPPPPPSSAPATSAASILVILVSFVIGTMC